MWDDEKTLSKIADAARKTVAFVTGYDRPKFMEDEKTQSAVLFQIVVIGEMVKRLSQLFRLRHSEMP